MELLDVSVLDGKGLITIAVSNIKDRIRLQDYFRQSAELFDERDAIVNKEKGE